MPGAPAWLRSRPKAAMSVPTVATMMPVRCSIPCQDVGVPGASVGNARSASPPAVIRVPRDRDRRDGGRTQAAEREHRVAPAEPQERRDHRHAGETTERQAARPAQPPTVLDPAWRVPASTNAMIRKPTGPAAPAHNATRIGSGRSLTSERRARRDLRRHARVVFEQREVRLEAPPAGEARPTSRLERCARLRTPPARRRGARPPRPLVPRPGRPSRPRTAPGYTSTVEAVSRASEALSRAAASPGASTRCSRPTGASVARKCGSRSTPYPTIDTPRLFELLGRGDRVDDGLRPGADEHPRRARELEQIGTDVGRLARMHATDASGRADGHARLRPAQIVALTVVAPSAPVATAAGRSRRATLVAAPDSQKRASSSGERPTIRHPSTTPIQAGTLLRRIAALMRRTHSSLRGAGRPDRSRWSRARRRRAPGSARREPRRPPRSDQSREPRLRPRLLARRDEGAGVAGAGECVLGCGTSHEHREQHPVESITRSRGVDLVDHLGGSDEHASVGAEDGPRRSIFTAASR